MSSPRPPRRGPAGACQRGVTVTPKSSRNEVKVLADGTIAVRVTAPPADGAANKAVLAVLAEALSVPRSRIEIVRGVSARQKLVRFELSAEDLERRLRLVDESSDGATS